MSNLVLQTSTSARDASQSGTASAISGTSLSTYGSDYLGVAWLNVTIAKNSWIARATITTYCVKNAGGTGKTTIYGEAANNAAAYTTGASNISNRTKTTANVAWSPTGLLQGWQDSPNVASLLQEVVTRASWASGNAFSTIWVNDTTVGSPYGYLFYAWDGGASNAAQLTVDYFSPSNATLAQGNVPNGISVTTTLGTATVTPGAVSASPSGINVTTTLGTATVTPGAVSASPSGISVTTTLGTATVSQTSGTQTATPSGIGVTLDLGVTTVTPGAVTTSPSGIGVTLDLGVATATAGAIVATPASITVTVTLGSALANLLPAARNLVWMPMPPTARWTASTPTSRWRATDATTRWQSKGPQQ